MGNLLNKKEPLDPRYLKPNGLYPPEQLKWDLRKMKKFVEERKVAPFYVGQEEPTNENDEECPICMLYYPGGLNRARCCRHPICTECYFSIRSPGSISPIDCPFCQRPNFITSFTGPLTEEERKKLKDEMEKVKQLELKIKQEEFERDRQREEERRKRRELEQQKQNMQQKSIDPEDNPPRNEAQTSDLTNLPQNDMDDDFLLQEAIRLSLMNNPT